MSGTVGELRAWRFAMFVVVMLAVGVFCVQRFVTQVFDVVFEICIFYIPTITVIVYIFHLSKKKG